MSIFSLLNFFFWVAVDLPQHDLPQNEPKFYPVWNTEAKLWICHISDGHTIERMRVEWKKGFDQSKVTENNYISLAQFEYAVFFEENYEEEIASGKSIGNAPKITIFCWLSSHPKRGEKVI